MTFPDDENYNLIDGRQLRAARAITGLTIREVAYIANINRNSVVRAESLQKIPYNSWAARRMERAFIAMGILFSVQENNIIISFSNFVR